MRKLFCLLLSILTIIALSSTAIAEAITGTTVFALRTPNANYFDLEQEGEAILGHLPLGAVDEIATLKTTLDIDQAAWGNLWTLVPVPQYEDGTLATEAEILFSVRVSLFDVYHVIVGGQYNHYEVHATWTGGEGVYLEQFTSGGWQTLAGMTRVEITSYAFRQGSVGAAPMDFGQLKSLFE